MKSVTAALKPIPGIDTVEVDLPTGRVTVYGDLPQGGDPVVLALTAAGYPAKVTSATAVATATAGAKKSAGCCG